MIGLESWLINLDFTLSDDTASAQAKPRYLELNLNFNPQKCADYDDLEELVVHELCHALTWRLWDVTDNLLEQNYGDRHKELWEWNLSEIHEEAVSRIAFALLRVHRKGLAQLQE